MSRRRLSICGIVGYVGHRSAREIILAGLERLEYRGYIDDALVATLAGDAVVAARNGEAPEGR